jgi:16S rRNA (cytidine1402-2'-O)-methyltransferase
MLYLIPTVLAEDTAEATLSPRIREIVTSTNHYLVENVRSARRFISCLKTGRVIDELQFWVLDKDTDLAAVRQYLSQLPADVPVGVLSEAGCPGVADPGALAVRVAHETGRKVVPLVGPSSILLALMGSGFSGQSFVFHGYLPIDKQVRVQKIRQLEKDVASRQTQIFMETPYRNNQLLADILANCRNETLLCIAANVTAPDEMIRSQRVAEWRKQVPDLHKIPTIFLLGS